jgi:hypothetical protein
VDAIAASLSICQTSIVIIIIIIVVIVIVILDIIIFIVNYSATIVVSIHRIARSHASFVFVAA